MLPSPPNLRTTLDSIDEALFSQHPIPPAERQTFALHILSHQIPDGPQAGLFHTGIAGRETAPRLFTGERLYTLLAARHTLLIDSARMLTLLEVKNDAVTRALEIAAQRMEARCYADFCAVGECRHLTLAFMRYLVASHPPGYEQRVDRFLNLLAVHRDQHGKWGTFPFFYTLLIISESYAPQAILERQYAAPVCADALQRPWKDDPFSQRRKAILEKVLIRSGGDPW